VFINRVLEVQTYFYVSSFFMLRSGFYTHYRYPTDWFYFVSMNFHKSKFLTVFDSTSID